MVLKDQNLNINGDTTTITAAPTTTGNVNELKAQEHLRNRIYRAKAYGVKRPKYEDFERNDDYARDYCRSGNSR